MTDFYYPVLGDVVAVSRVSDNLLHQGCGHAEDS